MDKDVTYHSCATCGTIVWVGIDALESVLIIKTGTIDDKDALNEARPVQEIYCNDRPLCVDEIAGIEHKAAA